MESKLNDCYFCGGKVKLTRKSKSGYFCQYPKPKNYQALCGTCHARGPLEGSPESAKYYWNIIGE